MDTCAEMTVKPRTSSVPPRQGGAAQILCFFLGLAEMGGLGAAPIMGLSLDWACSDHLTEESAGWW